MSDDPIDPPRGDAEGYDFGHLLGVTQYRAVEDAAVREDAADDEAAPVGRPPKIGPIPASPPQPPPAPMPGLSAPPRPTDPAGGETKTYDATVAGAIPPPQSASPPAPPAAVPINAFPADLAPASGTGAPSSVLPPPPGTSGPTIASAFAPPAPPAPGPTAPTVYAPPPPSTEPAVTAAPPPPRPPASAPTSATPTEPAPEPGARVPNWRPADEGTPGRWQVGMRLPSLPGSPLPADPPPVAAPPILETPALADSADEDPTAPQTVIDDDGLADATVSLASVRAKAAPLPDGPTVQAVHCPDGHPNPAHADRCRLCDQHIVVRAVTTIARPVLGIIRFDDGTEVEITGPLVLGRRPADDRVIEGEPARAVPLDDPEKVLSRNHAEIHIRDWQVQVVDRDSMNHTFLEPPGQELFRIPPAEPFAIVPGTRISLGEQINAVFEVSDR